MKSNKKTATIAFLSVAVVVVVAVLVWWGLKLNDKQQHLKRVQDALTEQMALDSVTKAEKAASDSVEAAIRRENDEWFASLRSVDGGPGVVRDEYTVDRQNRATDKEKQNFQPDTKKVSQNGSESEVNTNDAKQKKTVTETNTSKARETTVSSGKTVRVTETESPKQCFGGRGVITKSGATFDIELTGAYTINLHKRDGSVLHLQRGDRIEDATIRNGKLMQGNFVFADGTHKFISGLSESVR